MGRRYARNAAGDMNHLVCMGFTDPDAVVDDRPVVIFEAMEGLGQALAVARVLERVARVGVACAYDRAGFGWSDPFASHQRRGPDNIAQVAPVYVCVCMHASILRVPAEEPRA